MSYWKKTLLSFSLAGIVVTQMTYATIDMTYFPTQQVSAGYYNNEFIHSTFPSLPKPFFWGSTHHATDGFMLSYLKSAYHSKKYFSIFWGLSFSNWNMFSCNLLALSVFFEFRWWVFRTDIINPYFMYSIAGPTLLSNNHIGNSNLGAYVLFQDYLGAGIMFGTKHHFNLEAKVVHYSNGDLAAFNQGLQVPFLLALVYSW